MSAPDPELARLSYIEGMSRLAAAVNVITTDGPGGRAGFTASAVCSVTDSPPTLLVCLKQTASVYGIFARNGVLCVNTLTSSHVAVSKLFGGRTPADERFAAAEWTAGASGSPILREAAASFDCRIADKAIVGTHDVLFCEVLAVELGASLDTLVYLDRAYHVLALARAASGENGAAA